jgi:hypothetical protein
VSRADEKAYHERHKPAGGGPLTFGTVSKLPHDHLREKVDKVCLNAHQEDGVPPRLIAIELLCVAADWIGGASHRDARAALVQGLIKLLREDGRGSH